jgi:hypothetical protein
MHLQRSIDAVEGDPGKSLDDRLGQLGRHRLAAGADEAQALQAALEPLADAVHGLQQGGHGHHLGHPVALHLLHHFLDIERRGMPEQKQRRPGQDRDESLIEEIGIGH